jgi:hypothetical protein
VKRRRRSLGKNWVHVALASASRYALDIRLGPRTKETAVDLVATVALCGPASPAAVPLFLMDDHLPYPSALMEVYGRVKFGRRRKGRGRFKHPRLAAPPGLLAGVVCKKRDAKGNLLGVKTHGLFGSKRAVVQRVQELGVGQTIHTAHIERLNGTLRMQQSRLHRRTGGMSRRRRFLNWSLQVWDNLYNWTSPHRSLCGDTPAMREGLTDHVWRVREYINVPVHVSAVERESWAESRKSATTSELTRRNLNKTVPPS